MSHTVDLGDTGMFHIHHPAAVNPHQWSLFVLIHSWKKLWEKMLPEKQAKKQWIQGVKNK